MALKMSELFGTVLAVVFGLSLLPIVISQKTSAQTAINDSTSAEHTLVGLIPLIYVMIVIIGAGAYVFFKTRK